MSDSEKTEEQPEEPKLSLWHRLLLKVPKLSLDSFPEYFHGVFYSIVLPIFLIVTFVLTALFLVFIPFPFNYLAASVIPVFLMLYFGRTMTERFINWYKASFAKPKEWDVDKTSNEYFELLEQQKNRREKG